MIRLLAAILVAFFCVSCNLPVSFPNKQGTGAIVVQLPKMHSSKSLSSDLAQNYVDSYALVIFDPTKAEVKGITSFYAIANKGETSIQISSIPAGSYTALLLAGKDIGTYSDSTYTERMHILLGCGETTVNVFANQQTNASIMLSAVDFGTMTASKESIAVGELYSISYSGNTNSSILNLNPICVSKNGAFLTAVSNGSYSGAFTVAPLVSAIGGTETPITYSLYRNNDPANDNRMNLSMLKGNWAGDYIREIGWWEWIGKGDIPDLDSLVPSVTITVVFGEGSGTVTVTATWG